MTHLAKSRKDTYQAGSPIPTIDLLQAGDSVTVTIRNKTPKFNEQYVVRSILQMVRRSDKQSVALTKNCVSRVGEFAEREKAHAWSFTFTMLLPDVDSETSEKPPGSAALLLYCLLSKKDREPVLGDLKEEYPEICAEFGPRRARLWFWAQTIRSLWPLLSSAGGNLAKTAAKLTGLKWLHDFIGRFIS